MDSIWKALQDGSDNARNWIIEHQSEPALWIGLFFLGLLVFFVTYNALQKEK